VDAPRRGARRGVGDALVAPRVAASAAQEPSSVSRFGTPCYVRGLPSRNDKRTPAAPAAVSVHSPPGALGER
jgi:hypothetical protein